MNNDINNNSENPNTSNVYHATTNLNTAIENPTINMGSATGVNIEDNNLNNIQSEQNNIILNAPNPNIQQPNPNNNFIGNQSTIDNTTTSQTPNFSDYSSEYETNFYDTNDNNQYYSYEPIIQEKKNNANKKLNITQTKEAKLMVFIILILLIFILIIPYIYDFFLGL